MLDVIIVGGGPAGLSAALILGRCLRRVLVCDSGRPRNAASQALHGFLTRDGCPPLELIAIARTQLNAYETVQLRQVEVVSAVRLDKGFEVRLNDGTQERARKLLIASGVVDRIPQVEGISELYGRSVFHCPYCDGWEVRHQELAAYGKGKGGAGLALELRAWSDDVVLCTDGPGGLSASDRERLSRHGIAIREEPIARLEGSEGVLERIVFRNGATLARRAIFFSTSQRQRSDLAASLGCAFTRGGAVRTSSYAGTRVPDLYVAGDASHLVQLAIIAASEGAAAAFAINQTLLSEEFA
jgi:thioredoxin reductase